MDSKEQTQEPQGKKVTHLKEKKSKKNAKVVLSETKSEVVMSISHKAYKGEKIGNSIRKDRKFDKRPRNVANVSGRTY